MKGKGTCRFEVMSRDGVKNTMVLKDVLWVPSISGNLLSVRSLIEKGGKVNFTSDMKCEISIAGRQVAVAAAHENLYVLKVPEKVCAAEENHGECIHKWHRILGHRDIEVVRNLSSNNLVDGVSFGKCETNCIGKDVNCAVCLEGKMARAKFPHETKNRAQAVLDLVHSDVCGPMQTSTPSNKRYLMTIIDDYSRFTTLYLLNNKSEAFQNPDVQAVC